MFPYVGWSLGVIMDPFWWRNFLEWSGGWGCCWMSHFGYDGGGCNEGKTSLWINHSHKSCLCCRDHMGSSPGKSLQGNLLWEIRSSPDVFSLRRDSLLMAQSKESFICWESADWAINQPSYKPGVINKKPGNLTPALNLPFGGHKKPQDQPQQFCASPGLVKSLSLPLTHFLKS